MRRFILLAFIWGSFSLLGKAQLTDSRCSYDELVQQHEERFPGFQERSQAIEEYLSRTTSPSLSQRSVITIPVVVHILYTNDRENISDLQVYSQLEVLNEDFRLLNENVQSIPGEFQPLAADVEIEFCLASVDPEERPTTGINRVETSYECLADIGRVKTNGISRLFYSDLGGADAWDTQRYLNIWVANSCGVYIGITPSLAVMDFAPEEDGIVIDYNYFGNNCNSSFAAPYHLGRTATHEIGHFFGLRHPWGECGGADPDFVADTPIQSEPFFGCPSYPEGTCGPSEMFMNFMNYTDDACMAMFTDGQKQRMLAVLNGPRAGLLESVGCALLRPTIPFADEAIVLYPNPATDCIHIDFNAEIPGDVEVEMVNAAGQLLYRNVESSRNFRSIDAQNLTPGIYFVSFRAAKQTFTKKIMIAK